MKLTDMCTGNFYEHSPASHSKMARPPEGTRCVEPCVYENGRWGSSYCYTEDGNWGAECKPCPSKYIIYLVLSTNSKSFKIL